MKPSNPYFERTRQLFGWLQRYQPRVFAGLVRRFTPKEEQLSGIGDLFGRAVSAASSFVNSQGFEKILTAAQPFIANKIEKQQLELQLTRIKNGLAPQPPDPAAPASTSTSAGGSAPAPATEIPWKWILGGTGIAVGAALLFSGGRRRA